MNEQQPWYKKTAVQKAIVVGLFSLFVAVIAYVVGPLIVERYRMKSEPQTAQSPPSIQPSPTTASPSARSTGSPPVVIATSPKKGEEARPWLRNEHRVRALEPEESRLRVSDVPRRVYGFVDCEDLLRFLNSQQFRLHRSFYKPYDCEVHKLADGSIHLVGFVGHDTAIQAKLESRPKHLRITVYAFAWENAQDIISIPFTDIATLRDLRRIDLDKELGPRALEFELK